MSELKCESRRLHCSENLPDKNIYLIMESYCGDPWSVYSAYIDKGNAEEFLATKNDDPVCEYIIEPIKIEDYEDI